MAQHNYDFSALTIDETDAPFYTDIANHMHALGVDQQHAEIGVQVAQRIQAANDKADRGMVALTAQEMRNSLGGEFDGVWTGIQNWIAGLPQSIQGDVLWAAMKHPDGFRWARNQSELPPRDVAEGQPAAVLKPTARIGSPEYWRQLREQEAQQQRPGSAGVIVGADRRGFRPS